jgi:hypothetical protein
VGFAAPRFTQKEQDLPADSARRRRRAGQRILNRLARHLVNLVNIEQIRPPDLILLADRMENLTRAGRSKRGNPGIFGQVDGVRGDSE